MKRSFTYKHLPGLKKRVFSAGSIYHGCDDYSDGYGILSDASSSSRLLTFTMSVPDSRDANTVIVSPEISANPATAALECILNRSPLSIDEDTRSISLCESSTPRSVMMAPSTLFEVPSLNWLSDDPNGVHFDDSARVEEDHEVRDNASVLSQQSHSIQSRASLYSSDMSLSDNNWNCVQSFRNSLPFCRMSSVDDGNDMNSSASSPPVSVVPPLAFMPPKNLERRRTQRISNKKCLLFEGHKTRHHQAQIRIRKNTQQIAISSSSLVRRPQLAPRIEKTGEVGKLTTDFNRVLLLNYSTNRTCLS